MKIVVKIRDTLQKPVVLTTSGRSDVHNNISPDINDLTLARTGQITPAKSGKGQWLLYYY